MNKYDFERIEKKWQKIWDEKPEKAIDFDKKTKFYNLNEFPYPSGSGLHIGHCMGWTASDIYARMKRMQGFNVLFPIGWDAFGLPTENYAIKNKRKPADVTRENTDIFRNQMKSLAYSVDWKREINTSDPAYYKWTQWIFLQFYHHGIIDNKLVEINDDDKDTPRLAYQAEVLVNWCPSCKINLANEEVITGKCERCGTETEKRMQKQWMLRITSYADRLIKDLETVDYLDQIKIQQINWIGKSEGAEIEFKIKNIDSKIKVFTTRADTLFGCTYVVLAPEHQIISKIKTQILNLINVEDYIENAKKKTDIERTEIAKDKTGVKLEGVKAINPINNEEVDVWVADYVLANYGTGAVMAVPAHDDRDWEFAKKHSIEIKEVVIPKVIDKMNPPINGKETIARRAIQAIVINPKNNKVLVLKWKKFPWTTFITGGMESGEDIIDAAKREIIEETGYNNIKYMKTLGGPVESHFYAAHKNVNRKALFSALVFELENDKKIDTDKMEQEIHDIEWLDWDKLTHDKNLTCAEYDIWLDRFNNPEHAFTDYGVLINSNGFDGLSSKEAQKKIIEKLKEVGAGDFSTNYKLRDWIFSRQHYWGEPIPIIHCEKCGMVPMDEKDLPLILPDVENYEPTDTGESPLASMSDWVNVKCPKCGSDAKRETDTMPNWAGSSWYYLRYCDPNNDNQFASTDKLKYWTPVDIYNGGNEHTTLHLLYSRFWHKFLYDLDVVPTSEPYKKRITHGIILGPDGQKMSKSKGNIINPDDIVEKFGADTLRAYIMFIGPYDQESAWSTAGIQGVYRFLNRVWNNSKLVSNKDDSKELLVKLNQTINGITSDIESFSGNTVISKLMELNNMIEKEGSISKTSYKTFLKLLFPVAPHIASELWEATNIDGKIDTDWPKVDEKYLIADTITIAVQINGKTRNLINIGNNLCQTDIEEMAKKEVNIKNQLEGKNIKKVIYVAGRIVNFVLK